MQQPILKIFIPLALGLTALLGVTYINEQQILRGGANEPQFGLAQDAANTLSDTLTATTTGTPVAIESSRSPYIVVFDSYGNPVGGTGLLHGSLPEIPAGIFDTIRSKGVPDVLTWQPEPGIREAIVVVPVNGGAGGFVMGGRSLAYVEQEESQLTERTTLGWVGVMLITLLGSYLATRVK
ncbi:MAG TPA: hypothetical protein VHB93_02400 [Candidatus Paceibacterota bacterium]|nr:hypothetical protein [Candidatus Paceibacterota bacterium]